MSSIFISKPGTKYGPCVNKCDHKDCAESRADAAAPCVICGEPIGYDVDFYTDGILGAARTCKHASCAFVQSRTTKTTQS